MLRPRLLLLLLENREHLLAAVAEMAGRLFAPCSAGQVLAASRT